MATNFLCHCLGGWQVDISNYYIHARRCQGQRNTSPDAAATSGHHCCLLIDFHRSSPKLQFRFAAFPLDKALEEIIHTLDNLYN
jgi:hypothetical protein